MSRHIILTKDQWLPLKEKLKKDHAPSVILVRSKMRSVLGFVDRTHVTWDEGQRLYNEQICLDFYDEHKKTMFVLKYSDFLRNENSNN